MAKTILVLFVCLLTLGAGSGCYVSATPLPYWYAPRYRHYYYPQHYRYYYPSPYWYSLSLPLLGITGPPVGRLRRYTTCALYVRIFSR